MKVKRRSGPTLRPRVACACLAKWPSTAAAPLRKLCSRLSEPASGSRTYGSVRRSDQGGLRRCVARRKSRAGGPHGSSLGRPADDDRRVSDVSEDLGQSCNCRSAGGSALRPLCTGWHHAASAFAGRDELHSLRDCDSGAALIQAALSGLGAAYLLRCLVAKDLEGGTLVSLAAKFAFPSAPFSALHAFGRTVPLRVKLVCDFIAREAKALAAI